MATTLDLLNKVLTGLRKPTLGSENTEIPSQYHALLLQLLNRSKRKVEAAWDWHALRNTVTVSLTSGTAEYDLTAAGAADMDVGPRSRLLYENPVYGGHESSLRIRGSRPQVFDVTDANEFRLREVTWEQIERLHFTDSDEQQRPQVFALRRTASNVQLKVWPTPGSSRTLKMRFVIPQDDLPADDLTTTLTIPAEDAVWLDALHMANAERGEELGAPNSALAEDAKAAMWEHIVAERTQADDTGYPE